MLMLLTLIITSCSDSFCHEPQNNQAKQEYQSKNKIEMLRFNSKEELIQKLQSMKQNKGRSINDEFPHSLTTMTMGEIKQLYPLDSLLIDSIKLIKLDDLSLYLAAGYDTLVPEVEFAQLLNIKGQIQVADRIYKISPKGTYSYPASQEAYFSDNFSKLEDIDGIEVGDNMFCLEGDIYRFGTYNYSNDYILESPRKAILDILYPDYSNNNGTISPITGELPELKWSDFPIIDNDDVSGFSWLWSKLFGRDTGFTYDITSKRRVKAKFYYYDYIIHASTGAYVVMQKKNWIGWSGTDAQKLVLNWHNIIFESEYSVPPVASQFPSEATIAGTQYKRIPGINVNGNVVSILGLELSQSELEQLISATAVEIFNKLKNKLGNKTIPANTNAIMLYMKDKVITIIPDGIIEAEEREKIEVKFADTWGFYITFDLSNLSQSWIDVFKSVLNTELQHPRLLYGEVRAAGCIYNTWGGMTLIKYW